MLLNLIAHDLIYRELDLLHPQVVLVSYLVMGLHFGLAPRDVLQGLLQACNYLLIIALRPGLVIGGRVTRLMALGDRVSLELSVLDFLELVIQKVRIEVGCQGFVGRALIGHQIVALTVILPNRLGILRPPRDPSQHRHVFFTFVRAPRDLSNIEL